jgi:TonB family protein
MNALDYLLKANLYGLLFVGCYWLFLRRHTFFSLNRAYLLASVVLSLTLPLVTLPAETAETLPAIPVGVMALPVATVTSTAMPVAESGPDWQQLGLWAYSFVALVLLVRLSIRVGRLLRLIRQSPRQVADGYTQVLPNDETLPTFSFFNYIILNPADAHNELILRHERVHVRQYHSADVLGLGIVQAVFWACPALLLLERMLRQVHEFLADQPASQPTEYAEFLVAYSFGTPVALQDADTITNSFFTPSLLKQRIIMLHQKATTRWALGKYVLVLPLAFGLLAMTTARQELSNAVDQLTQDKGITVTGEVTSSVDGKPLPGAIAMIANTGKGIPTDAQGKFILKNVPKTATISFSFIGYRTDILALDAFKSRIKNNQLSISPKLTPNLEDELPPMGATAAYKAIKPNPAMPIRTPPSSETINGKVFTAVEEPAVFPTGIPGLMQYVAHALRYPARAKASGIQGDVYVIFTVLPTGGVDDVKVNKNIKRIGGGCEEEAIRIVSQMPKWLPAKQNNKSVSIRYQLPIRFELEKRTDDKRTGQITPDSKPSLEQPVGNILNNNKHKEFALYDEMSAVRRTRFRRISMRLPDSLQKQEMSSIHVRSNGFSIGDPLYIIDGVEIQKGAMSKLSPNDIDNVTVLKGESATVGYGEKGKNGVVLITTKKK